MGPFTIRQLKSTIAKNLSLKPSCVKAKMANVDMDDLEQALIQEAQNLESIDAATDLEIELL